MKNGFGRMQGKTCNAKAAMSKMKYSRNKIGKMHKKQNVYWCEINENNKTLLT